MSSSSHVACIQNKTDAFWWQLAGIQQAMNDIVMKLVNQHLNIVVCFPQDRQYLEVKVTEYLQKNLLGDCGMPYLRFDVSDPQYSHKTPLMILLDYFVPHRDALDFQGVSSLIENPHFRNTCIFLEHFETFQQWEDWKSFLEEYQCLTRERFELPRFCVILSGELTMYSRCQLQEYRWQNIVSINEMLLYSSNIFQRYSKFSGIQAQVASAIAGRLALWDKRIVDELVDVSLEDILKPEKILRKIATQYGWSTQYFHENENLKWELGFSNQIDGQTVFHSGYLALSFVDNIELKNRVWQGQMAVLLPYVEYRRLNLLPQLRQYLYDIEESTGEIKKIDNLEIGEIWYQIRNSTRAKSSIPSKIIVEIEKLYRIRNSLAHNDTINRELLPNGD